MNNITTKQERENTMSDNMVDATVLMDLIITLQKSGEWNGIIASLLQRDANFVINTLNDNYKVVLFSYDNDDKIPAVKFIRALTGLGLQESKHFVEHLENEQALFSGTLNECQDFIHKVCTHDYHKPSIILKVIKTY